VRLLLDAHVSGRNIGEPLARSGHDVRALDREPALEGLDDSSVLGVGSAEGRILISFNVADFPTIMREWALASRTHAGVMLVYGIDHSEFILVARGLERWLAAYAEQSDWTDRAVVIPRDFASK